MEKSGIKPFLCIILLHTRSIPEMMQKMREWRGLPQGAIKGYSSDLVDLIRRMLHPDYHRRPTAEEIEAECCIGDRQDTDDEQ